MNFIKKKINNKMNLYLFQKNDEDLKKYYKYTLDKKSPVEINSHLKFLFRYRLSELNILEKFKEFKTKFKNYQSKNESENDYKRLYDEIVHEYNQILDKGDEIWDFNDDLLENIEYDSKEILNNFGKKGLSNINKEILDSVVDSYIKLDKSLIIIKNKINNLINSII